VNKLVCLTSIALICAIILLVIWAGARENGRMLRIKKLKLSKKILSTLTPAERSLLLLLGHASNEINVLQKLILMSRPQDGAIMEINIAQSGQALILLRLLIGKLHEGWLLFQRRVQANTEFRSALLTAISPAARAALIRLNAHFGGGSPLPDIRNKLAFHSRDDDDLVEKSFHALPADENWDFYLGNSIANTFYHASELVMTRSSIDLVRDDGDVNAGFDELLGQSTSVAGDIGILFAEIIAEIGGAKFADVPMETFEVPHALKLSDFSLPYFLDEDDLRQSRDELKAKKSTS
jgi:hypothetical protein